MKVWMSKWALSEGVTEHETDPQLPRSSIDPDCIYIEGLYGGYKFGRDVHGTRAAAVAAAEAMRIKKIASLRKQIAKLEKLTF